MHNPVSKFILKMLLKSAVYFEEQSRDFYLEAISRVSSPQARDTLRALAAEEDRHREKLLTLSSDEQLEEIILSEQHAKLPPAVADAGSAPRVATGAGFAEVLEIAHRREEASEAFYAELSRKATLPAARQVFAFLAEEEKRHVAWVEHLRKEAAQ